jgi:hypothetical protein
MGSVVIAALALVVAFASVVLQRQSNSATQSNNMRAEASLVSIIQEQGGSTFDIDNLARSPIYSVWLFPAPREPRSVGTLPPCSISSVVLTPASSPVIYFKDANGVSWERTISGTLQQSVNPSSLASFLPLASESVLSERINVTTTTSPSCS